VWRGPSPDIGLVTTGVGWLGSRVSYRTGLRRRRARVQIAVATLSGNSLRQTIHTHCASVHQAAKLVAALLRVAEVTAGLVKSNGSLPPGLWLTSPAGWLPRTGISSGTLRLVIEYGLPPTFTFFTTGVCVRVASVQFTYTQAFTPQDARAVRAGCGWRRRQAGAAPGVTQSSSRRRHLPVAAARRLPVSGSRRRMSRLPTTTFYRATIR